MGSAGSADAGSGTGTGGTGRGGGIGAGAVVVVMGGGKSAAAISASVPSSSHSLSRSILSGWCRTGGLGMSSALAAGLLSGGGELAGARTCDRSSAAGERAATDSPDVVDCVPGCCAPALRDAISRLMSSIRAAMWVLHPKVSITAT